MNSPSGMTSMAAAAEATLLIKPKSSTEFAPSLLAVDWQPAAALNGCPNHQTPVAPTKAMLTPRAWWFLRSQPLQQLQMPLLYSSQTRPLVPGTWWILTSQPFYYW